MSGGHTTYDSDELGGGVFTLRLKEAAAKAAASKVANGAPKEESPSTKEPVNNEPQMPWTSRLVCAADVVQGSTEWLWLNRIPRGELALLSGLKGAGKTQLLASVAYHMTTGAPWPDEVAQRRREPCDVILVSAEDSREKTLVPRLAAAGAVLERVHILPIIKIDPRSKRPRAFLLSDDLEELEREIDELSKKSRPVGLVGLDPITSTFGSGRVNSNNTTDVRGVLTPVTEFANRKDIAFFGVTHPAKNTQKALDAFIGSQAFVAVARTAFLSAEDESEEGRAVDRRLFSVVANNLGPKLGTLTYHLEQRIVARDERTQKDVTASYVVWGRDIGISANEIVRMSSGQRQSKCERVEEEIVSEVERAKAFLEERLRNGPMDQKEIESWAQAELIKTRTLKRAKLDLGIQSRPRRPKQGELSKDGRARPVYEWFKGPGGNRNDGHQ